MHYISTHDGLKYIDKIIARYVGSASSCYKYRELQVSKDLVDMINIKIFGSDCWELSLLPFDAMDVYSVDFDYLIQRTQAEAQRQAQAQAQNQKQKQKQQVQQLQLQLQQIEEMKELRDNNYVCFEPKPNYSIFVKTFYGKWYESIRMAMPKSLASKKVKQIWIEKCFAINSSNNNNKISETILSKFFRIVNLSKYLYALNGSGGDYSTLKLR